MPTDCPRVLTWMGRRVFQSGYILTVTPLFHTGVVCLTLILCVKKHVVGAKCVVIPSTYHTMFSYIL